MPSIRVSSFYALIAVFVTSLVACDDDLTSAQDFAEFAVTLDITGTPGQGQFVVEWTDVDGSLSERTPLNPDALPRTFTEVPLGNTRVEFIEMPSDCSADETTKTTDVVRYLTREVRFDITCQDASPRLRS